MARVMVMGGINHPILRIMGSKDVAMDMEGIQIGWGLIPLGNLVGILDMDDLITP